MIAYKGFRKDLTCTLGKGVFPYHTGETIREESSKCAARGMHCAEYVLDCLGYYPLGSGNRYFQVEAAGSLDEDGTDTRISCTEMTLIKELSIREITLQAMIYMISHPQRAWEKGGMLLDVGAERAEGAGAGSIAIARGKNPRIKGKPGSVMGLLKEEENGEIGEAKLFTVDGIKVKQDIWYVLQNGELKEVQNETESNP